MTRKLTQKTLTTKLCDLKETVNGFDKSVLHWAIVEVEKETVTLSVTILA